MLREDCNFQISFYKSSRLQKEAPGGPDRTASADPQRSAERLEGGGAHAAGSGGRAEPRPQRQRRWPSPPPCTRGARRKGTEGGDDESERRHQQPLQRKLSGRGRWEQAGHFLADGLSLELAKAGPQPELPQYLGPRRGR